MQDPTQPILAAFCAALANLTLPVYTTLPTGIDEYVLLSQPTLVPGRGSAACPAWEATLLLTIYTRFGQAGAASFGPALAVSEDIFAATVGQRLDLGSFSMSPVELGLASFAQSGDDAARYVQRAVRLRFTVYGTPTVVVPRGQTVNDFTPAQVLADYAQLAALGPLNCPVVPVVQTLRFVFSAESVDSIAVPLGGDNPTTLNEFSPFDGSFTLAVNGTTLHGKYVGQAGDVLTVTRLSGNPTVMVGYNSALA